MTGTFLKRTLRTVVAPGRPYFAHLAITHRCNLRCRFCHVTDSPFKELDTEPTKHVIDALDRMGIAVISISGGENRCCGTISMKSSTTRPRKGCTSRSHPMALCPAPSTNGS